MKTSIRHDEFNQARDRLFRPRGAPALRLKAAETDRSLSELVNTAVRMALAEDAEDLAAFDERRTERSESFESAVKTLKRRGKL